MVWWCTKARWVISNLMCKYSNRIFYCLFSSRLCMFYNQYLSSLILFLWFWIIQYLLLLYFGDIFVSTVRLWSIGREGSVLDEYRPFFIWEITSCKLWCDSFHTFMRLTTYSTTHEATISMPLGVRTFIGLVPNKSSKQTNSILLPLGIKMAWCIKAIISRSY